MCGFSFQSRVSNIVVYFCVLRIIELSVVVCKNRRNIRTLAIPRNTNHSSGASLMLNNIIIINNNFSFISFELWVLFIPSVSFLTHTGFTCTYAYRCVYGFVCVRAYVCIIYLLYIYMYIFRLLNSIFIIF